MSERYKPRCTERYYYIRNKGDVDDVLWCDDTFDHEYYEFGNCFRTKKEATNAAKKVKALLLSLHEPTKGRSRLPDWCKVGEWVWAIAFNAYFKVDKVDDLFIYGTDFPGSEYSVAINNVRQARLRPFNTEEMRGMVGKVINNPCSSRLVTAYNESDCIKILTSIGWYTADDLMTSDYTIDGKPCGVLEHLNENGEWME